MSKNNLTPATMDLAKLAAILSPHAQPAEALKRAMEFYVEALLFVRGLPTNLEDLITLYGSEQRIIEGGKQRAVEFDQTRWKDTLELDCDPNKQDDGVRRFLYKKGLKLKNARSVLENLRRCLKTRSVNSPSVDKIIEQCKQPKDGRAIYAIPKFLLEVLVTDAMNRRSESKRKAWKTRQSKSSV